MCCNRRRNRQHVPVAVAIAGAAYNRYHQHKIQQQQQQPQNEQSMSQAVPPYTIDQPATQQAPFELSGAKSSLLHQEDKAPVNPPSYDTIVMNRAIVPDDDTASRIAPYAKPTLMNRRDAGDASSSSSSSSISSLESVAATLPQEGGGRRIPSIEIPEGTTWWQAYRARKSERGEAKRAEKAEWKAEKAEWRAARRMAKARC